MDDRLKDLLLSQVEDEVGRGAPGQLRRVVVRGRRRKTLGRVATAAAVVCVVAAASLVPRLPVFTSDAQAPVGGPEQPEGETMANGCPVSKGGGSETTWTSPVTLVASGTFGGEDWVLCARTAERTDNSDEGLCTNWRLGDGLGSGMDCTFGYDGEELIALDEDYVSVQMGPVEGYIVGAVPAASASAVLEKADGTKTLGEIHPAPEDLGVPFKFVTVFDEPYGEGELVVRDESGDVVLRRKMEHDLAPLHVRIGGDGDGKVVGYRTEQLLIYEGCRQAGRDDCREPRPTWIDCPDECTAGLAGAQITLFAEPAEGSTFAGWLGECLGTEPCELVVDREMHVEAKFADVP